jgi:DNA-binding transcriptional LysR family regulator
VQLSIGHLHSSSIVARRVGHVRWILVASPRYLPQRDVPTAPDQLSEHEMVLVVQPGGGTDLQFPGPDGTRSTVHVTGRFQVDRTEAAIAAARQDRGVLATLSYQVAHALVLIRSGPTTT